MLNFTVRDVLGVFLGFSIFPLVLVFPGYVLGWGLNLFDFRSRLPVIRYVISLVVSNAVVPIVLYLIYRFLSANYALIVLIACTIGWGIILIISRKKDTPTGSTERSKSRWYQTIAWIIAGVWVGFSIIWLVDVQVGNRLYFNTVAYDYTTRVAVVDAITRTGVPPVNPGYYPGFPVKLTDLYYFWYILASVVDRVGGNLVDARMAFIASVAWCGLCLMATIGLYLRIRNGEGGTKAWKLSILGSQLLLVSGLDIIPVVILFIRAEQLWGHLILDGRIEGWNTPIMTWLGALMWVPLHVSALMACLVGMMLFLYSSNQGFRKQAAAALISGLAFASSLGLSAWVTFTFAVFWAVWMVVRFINPRNRTSVLWMAFAGAISLCAAFPFIRDLLAGSTASPFGSFPISFFIRPFPILDIFLNSLTPLIHQLIYLLLLPVNYFMELGFFFLVGLIWIQIHWRKEKNCNPFYTPEIILLLTVIFLLTFVSSNLTGIDDLGIRAWLLGQFVLLIWTVDLVQHLLLKNKWAFPLNLRNLQLSKGSALTRNLLVVLFTIGVLTTALDMCVLRTWTILIDLNIVGFPNDLSPDMHLGERTYDARLAYDFVRDKLPINVIVQPNPSVVLDRPSGLYGTRQIAISDHTEYGISPMEFLKRVDQISQIFLEKNPASWSKIDHECSQNFINILIVNDTDPLWYDFANLKLQRAPLYENSRYALFECGYSSISSP